MYGFLSLRKTLDENGESTDCMEYDNCKKYLSEHPEDASDWGMCNGCDHFYTTGMY